MKYVIAALLLVHGLIHFMGFTKAFNYGNINKITTPISKQVGMLWLLSSCLFIITSILLLLKKDYWWALAFLAIIVSEIIIIMSWKDAKSGTIINILILVAAIFSWGSSHFENSYQKDVSNNLQNNSPITTDLINEADLQNLPSPVQRYMKFVGVIGKPKVKNMRVTMEIQMREKGKDFFNAVSEQYNFFEDPTRLFFMKAKMTGITVPGYHHYMNGNAVMDIRFAGLIPIAKKECRTMNTTETVTLFNDMCLMAPATLIDKRIVWDTIDSNSVKAVFTNHGISISAILYFNEQGQLTNFLSNDRTEVNSMKTYPFTTPVHSYQSINGFNLFNEGDAVWQYPDGAFVYGKFKLKDISYNVNR